jgi:hypothetical protein
MSTATRWPTKVEVSARPARPPEELWQMVLAHDTILARHAATAVRRGTRSDYDDALSEAQDIAYHAALTHGFDVAEEFAKYLNHVLPRRLRTRRSTDALDYVTDSQELEPKARPQQVADTEDALAHRIGRLPAYYRHIARMAFIEERMIGTITRRTGRQRVWVERTIRFLKKALSV